MAYFLNWRLSGSDQQPSSLVSDQLCEAAPGFKAKKREKAETVFYVVNLSCIFMKQNTGMGFPW